MAAVSFQCLSCKKAVPKEHWEEFTASSGCGQCANCNACCDFPCSDPSEYPALRCPFCAWYFKKGSRRDDVAPERANGAPLQGEAVVMSLGWTDPHDEDDVVDCVFGTVTLEWGGRRFRAVTAAAGDFPDGATAPRGSIYPGHLRLALGSAPARGRFCWRYFDDRNEPGHFPGEYPSHRVITIERPELGGEINPRVGATDFVWDQLLPRGFVFKICPITRADSYHGPEKEFNVLCVEYRDWGVTPVAPGSLAWTERGDVDEVADLVFGTTMINEGGRSFRAVTAVASPLGRPGHCAPASSVAPGDLDVAVCDANAQTSRFCWRWFCDGNVEGAQRGAFPEHRVITVEKPVSDAAAAHHLNVSHFFWDQPVPHDYVFGIRRIVRTRNWHGPEAAYHVLTIEEDRKVQVVPDSLAWNREGDGDELHRFVFDTTLFTVGGITYRVVVAVPGAFPAPTVSEGEVAPAMLDPFPGFPPDGAHSARFCWRYFAEGNVPTWGAHHVTEYRVITLEGYGEPIATNACYAVADFAWASELPAGLRFNSRQITRPAGCHGDEVTFRVLTVE